MKVCKLRTTKFVFCILLLISIVQGYCLFNIFHTKKTDFENYCMLEEPDIVFRVGASVVRLPLSQQMVSPQYIESPKISNYSGQSSMLSVTVRLPEDLYKRQKGVLGGLYKEMSLDWDINVNGEKILVNGWKYTGSKYQLIASGPNWAVFTSLYGFQKEKTKKKNTKSFQIQSSDILDFGKGCVAVKRVERGKLEYYSTDDKGKLKSKITEEEFYDELDQHQIIAEGQKDEFKDTLRKYAEAK